MRRGFLSLLGVVYCLAFGSLWIQLTGLMGADGIAPVADLLAWASERFGSRAPLQIPTLFWIASGDAALHAGAAAGLGLSIALVLGFAPGASCLGLWLLYLSFVSAGGVFLAYQWDTLLLETGLLACFWAPWRLSRRRASAAPVARLPLWALRFLLFRLILTSGLAKLTSGDPAWRDLSALEFHYFTQPLPASPSWFVHQLPPAVHAFGTAVTLLVEIGAPWLIFGGRRAREIAAGAIAALMFAIAATGNYGFFNLLTLALCWTLLDERTVSRFWRSRFAIEAPPARKTGSLGALGRGVAAALIGLLAAIGTLGAIERVGVRLDWPRPVDTLRERFAPLRSANAYGLFAVMTTERPEIVVEGSRDGEHWTAYPFVWKPGALERAPRFAQPHMPRLDWQMWFAALGSCDRNRWFVAFQERLLRGSPAVLALLEADPFAGTPPRYVRSTLYTYAFTDGFWDEPDWWTRQRRRLYCPVLELREGALTIVPAPPDGVAR